jgi:hypothetical protein
MTVETRNKSIAVVKIRRRGVDGAKAGDIALLLSSFRSHAGLTLSHEYRILNKCVIASAA